MSDVNIKAEIDKITNFKFEALRKGVADEMQSLRSIIEVLDRKVAALETQVKTMQKNMSKDDSVVDPAERKPLLDLLPPDALWEVGVVMTKGAEKHGADDWEMNPRAWRTMLAKALRHTLLWAVGLDRDPDTGCLHTAHAVACLLILVSYQLRNTGKDDRTMSTR